MIRNAITILYQSRIVSISTPFFILVLLELIFKFRIFSSIIHLMQQESISRQSQISDSTEPISYARNSPLRFLVLFLVIMVAFADQYTFNNPQALQDSMETILEIGAEDFQLFYSLYALPNIFTLLFIGYFCDYFGVRITIMLLSGLVAFFQLLIAIGGYARSFPTILVGRILFGIVSQAVFIPQASIISFWFQGKEQAFALGIAITFPQLGNALNSYLTPIIFERTQTLGAPLMFSFGLCVIGFICALLTAYMDLRADQIDEQNRVQVLSGSASSEENEEIKLSHITKLRKSYWIIAAVCTAAMTLWIPFLDNVNRLFQKRFCYTQLTAGRVVTIAYLMAVVTSIPLGLFVDKFGHRRILCVMGLLVFLIAQIIILVYPQCDSDSIDTMGGAAAGLYLQGFGYSFYANVMVASIPLVVKMKFLGTAFGIMEMLQSFFEFIVPLITGFILSNASSPEAGYRISSALFVLMGIAGLVIGTLLYCCISDHAKRKLDRSSQQHLLLVAKRQESPHLFLNSMTSETSPQNSPNAPGGRLAPRPLSQSYVVNTESSLRNPLLVSFNMEL